MVKLRSACARSDFHITLLHVKINQLNDHLITPLPAPFFVLKDNGKKTKKFQVHNSADEVDIMAAVLYLTVVLYIHPSDKDIKIALEKAFNTEDKADCPYDDAKGIFEVSGSPTSVVVSEAPNTS